jgi:ubiquitin carboxyl-terminal hydrolase 36/42
MQFKLGRQEDSHEFLRYLVEGMQEAETGKLGKEREANEAKIRGSRAFKVFGGVMKTCVDCLNCNNKSITTERYYDFNIVPNLDK